MPKVSVGILLKTGNKNSNTHIDEALVLLCQRQKNARYGLKWEFPGGKAENGESAEQVLCRELLEECGINVTGQSLYFHSQASYPDGGEFEISYFLITDYHGEILHNAFQAVEWVPISKLYEYDILEGNNAVLEKLIKEYSDEAAQ